MSLSEELDKLRERLEGNLPPTTLSIMHGATRTLAESGISERVLRAGDRAPEFALEDRAGQVRSSKALLSEGPLALTFYRGFWCGYCNADLAALRDIVPSIEQGGARLVAISPEKPEYSRKITRLQRLNFDILHDAGNEVAAAFGLRYELAPELRELYRDHFNINLKLYHGDGDWTLPIPARFVIDPSGVIHYAESSADYTRRPEPSAVLDALAAL